MTVCRSPGRATGTYPTGGAPVAYAFVQDVAASWDKYELVTADGSVALPTKCDSL
jgi:hypothetical protein